MPENLSSTCRLYADDVKLYRPLADPAVDFSLFQKDLNSLSSWSKVWQLDFSIDKCRVFHVNFLHECFLRLDGHVLVSDDLPVRDLGVYFASNLKWAFHCSFISSKALVVGNCILRSLSYPSLVNYRLAFITFCRPILEYCNPI